ncbi:rhomboid family intramembrane serine protease [Lentisalinibacter salinarum]|uniref:rhomboid family intramembrane serine protease n=1 Tax=Lentisalinibacter salinarum TaxID=2992239 RepID=UPI003864CCEB
MFPLRDENPHFLTPYATWGLIGLNVLAWVLVQGLGTEPALSRSMCNLALIPGEVLQTASPGTRVPLGPGITCVLGDSSTWYTTITSMFLHGGWFHLIGNMWFLYIFGNNVEDSMGHTRFVIFYLLCGLAAAALQTVFDPDSTIPMVGASGAIGGVMGAYILLYPKVRVHTLIVFGFYITTIAVPAVFMLGYWFLLQLISGFSTIGSQGGGVAFWAHVGGFVAGGLLILLFRDPRLVKRHPNHGWNPRG